MDVAGEWWERCGEELAGDGGARLSCKNTRASLMNLNTCASGFVNPADVAVAAFHGAFSLTRSLGEAPACVRGTPRRQPLRTIRLLQPPCREAMRCCRSEAVVLVVPHFWLGLRWFRNGVRWAEDCGSLQRAQTLDLRPRVSSE